MEQSIKHYADLATIFWRISRIVKPPADKPEAEVRKIEREVDRFGRVLNDVGIEVNDYQGRRNNNLNVEVVAIEPDETVSEEIIYETIQPEIRHKGIVQQKSRVVVHTPTAASAGASTNAQAPPDRGGDEPFEPTAPAKQGEPEPVSEKQKTWVLIWLILLTAALLVLAFFQNEKLNNQQSAIEGLTQTVAEQEADIVEQRDAVEDMQAAVDGMKATIEQPQEQPETQPALVADDGGISLERYVVKEGDTLLSICEAHGIDFAVDGVAVQNMNGLKDADRIYVGQVLFLPVYS